MARASSIWYSFFWFDKIVIRWKKGKLSWPIVLGSERAGACVLDSVNFWYIGKAKHSGTNWSGKCMGGHLCFRVPQPKDRCWPNTWLTNPISCNLQNRWPSLFWICFERADIQNQQSVKQRDRVCSLPAYIFYQPVSHRNVAEAFKTGLAR